LSFSFLARIFPQSCFGQSLPDWDENMQKREKESSHVQERNANGRDSVKQGDLAPETGMKKYQSIRALQ
jgi:hypothetical protein